MSEYKKIPSFPMFEINDEESMDKCIRTVDTKKYLKTWVQNIGYPDVILNKKYGGDKKHHLIHRLVAETYLGPCPEGMEIDHIDTNKLNFNHNNLHFVTRKQNLNNPLTRTHFKNRDPETRKKRAKPVLQIDKENGNIINEYFGVREAGRRTGLDWIGISKCCRGKQKSAYGYIWKFKNN